MPKAPLIAVMTDRKELDGFTWHATIETYLKALTDVVGAIPVLVPALGERIAFDDLLDRVDGVLATGARSNVFPTLYGMEPHERAAPFDEGRDATAIPLISGAIEKGVPLLAICRGFQELNVALGGTLLSEVHEHDDRMDHRAPETENQDERFAITHAVEVAEEGHLRRLFGDQQISVNSLHRQAVGELAEELIVEAHAPDGTIEAVSLPKAPGYVLGVQWHPEYWAGTDPVSTRIFEDFGAVVRAYAAGRMPDAAE